MKVVFGIPLSVYKIVNGVYIKYEKGKKIAPGYIVGSKEQHPDLILYNPEAILVKYGGVLSHLAMLCREKGIPLFKVKNLDDLVDGEPIIVIPVKKEKTKISDISIFTLRIITNQQNFQAEHRRIYSTMKYVANRYGLKVNLEYKGTERNIMYFKVYVKGYKKLFDNALNNPDKYVHIIQEDIQTTLKHKIPLGIYLIGLGEALISYLAEKYGYDRVLEAIPPYEIIWKDVPDTYFEVRFGLRSKESIKKLRELSKGSSRKIKPLEGKDQRVLELALNIFKLYEIKNLIR